MDQFNLVTYVLMFAAVTIVLIFWGMKKSITKNEELFQILLRKGKKKIYNTIRRKGPLKAEDLEKAVKGIKASLVYSTKRLQVKDEKAFTGSVLEDMVSVGILQKEKDSSGNILYSIREE